MCVFPIGVFTVDTLYNMYNLYYVLVIIQCTCLHSLYRLMTSCSVLSIKYPIIMLTDRNCKQARHTLNRMLCVYVLVKPLHCMV